MTGNKIEDKEIKRMFLILEACTGHPEFDRVDMTWRGATYSLLANLTAHLDTEYEETMGLDEVSRAWGFIDKLASATFLDCCVGCETAWHVLKDASYEEITSNVGSESMVVH